MFIATVSFLIAQAGVINTTCNLRYNNRGIIYGDVPCQVQFVNRKLNSVSFVYPRNNTKYSWKVDHTTITFDPRWNECVRHTDKDGNQWQVCTVPSPNQLGL
jgi:hypothetical protein